MSDAPIPLPGRTPAPMSAAPIDPLAGDWSEGLPGPVRALGVPEPRRLTLEVAAPVEAVAAPAAWEGATADPLHSRPEPARATTETATAETATAETPAQDAPTPWSEPVAQAAEEVVWEAPAESGSTEAAPQASAASPEAPLPEPAPEAPAEPAPEAGHDAWLAPPPAPEPKAEDAWATPAEVVEEWQPEAPDAVPGSAPEAAALPEAPPPDWSTLTPAGPDWSATPEAAAPAQDGWDALPPSPAASDWMAAPAEPPSPEPAAPAPGPAWNAPSVGASALEQLDSEPPEPEPGAAQRLFGSVPAGGSLSGDDDAAAPDVLAPVSDDLAAPDAGDDVAVPEVLAEAGDGVTAPEVLAEAEDILRPVDPHDDPDLPVALDEPGPAPKPLAAFRPAAAGALEVAGEHRVAVHTRGGRTLRGTVCDVDLSKSQFALQPQGGGNTEIVYHSDVKVIFFMLPPGEKVAAADGGHVRVKLPDGRVIEGERDGAEARHGFFLVPGDAARTNTRRIYVAREAADEIEG